MTQRLDLSDATLLRFEAEVMAVRTLGGRPAVVLDRTAFYPEGGGQPADRGRLGSAAVVDVQEVEGEVLHGVDGPLPAGKVVGEVDAARRWDHVQQHHGQHLLSAALEKVAGAHTLSFHLGQETCTIDLDRPLAAMGPEPLRAAEALANELVFRDLPVTVREFSAVELARLPLRKEPARGSRVVVVAPEPVGEGFDPAGILDASPCGGTHPARTGAVGVIAILRAQKWGAGTRIDFLCGGRVVAALAQAERRIQEAAAALRCAPAELPAAAARAAAESAARRKELERLLAAAAEVEADRLAAAVVAPAPVRAVLAPPVAGAAAWARMVAQALAARGRVGLLGAVEEGRAQLAFARPRGPGVNMGELLRAAAAALGGKGGGSQDFAQGSGGDIAKLEQVLGEAEKAFGV